MFLLFRALIKIHQFLKDAGTYEKAFKMLSSVLEIFGDVEELQVTDDDLETIKVDGDETEEEESEEEDSEVQEEKETRFEIFSYFLTIKFFLFNCQ